MQEERTTPHTLLPEEPGTPEPTAAQNDTVEAAASMDEGSAEGQAAPASSDGHKAPLTKPVTEILGIPEWMRGKDGDLESKQVTYTCDPAVASAIHEMAARAKYERDPWKQMPVPTMREAYGTTGNLFARIKQTIGEQTHLSDKDSALLTFWALSTWFQDVLPLAPGLAVSGWAHEGEVVLRTLRAFCYHPILIAGMTSATLNDIDWDRKPTLLISEPALSKRMAALLGTSTCRGYLARRKVDGFLNCALDLYSSKAIYLGEDPPLESMLQHYLHINASLSPGVESLRAVPLSEKVTQSFQNQLLDFRIACARRVFKSEFNASGLPPEISAIANALGQCVFNAPDLQDELVSLLKPAAQQQIAERLDDLGTLVAGAALSLCHQGKEQVLVGEIAAEVNRMQEDRGEKSHYSPEKVGHRMKKEGLFSRRLSAAGNGFVLDHPTQVLLHKVAATYGCVGLTDSEKNLHCLLCEQNK